MRKCTPCTKKRKITDEDVAEYLAKRVAKKLKAASYQFQDWESKEEESDSDRRRSRSEADNLDKAMGATEEGGAVFGGSSDEVNIDSPVYSWRDEYCPRKPKYSNRVHTGYEWNKYNRTHYDHDNPPPKAVQGYKFNIFYPDLADKTKACPQKLLLMLYRE
ncbi:hypothetical protein C3L33_14449, partial [Rhododendron williamsianum]